jgi:hypothetical protein
MRIARLAVADIASPGLSSRRDVESVITRSGRIFFFPREESLRSSDKMIYGNGNSIIIPVSYHFREISVPLFQIRGPAKRKGDKDLCLKKRRNPPLKTFFAVHSTPERGLLTK